MAYSLFWRSPALPYLSKQNPITVPTGAVVSNAASLRFTGKGAANYGKIQQENMMRLLESFAGPTAPDNPTVGQTWYDTASSLLKVCIATPPVSVSPLGDWRSLNAAYVTNVGEPAPSTPALGDTWFARTGPKSGVLYLYTGIGRYPSVPWNARASGWAPPIATTNIGIRINTASFSGGSGSSFNRCYIHGYTGSTPANVAGTISTGTSVLSLPAQALPFSRAISSGYIVYDANPILPNAVGSRYHIVRQVARGAWEYDDGTSWIPLTQFSINTNIWVIGMITVSKDDGASPGVTFAELWSTAIELVTRSQTAVVPAVSKTSGAAGGWEQLWPHVEIAAGKEEYNEMYADLMKLIGPGPTFRASGAAGKAVTLTDFGTLDSSVWIKITQAPQDANNMVPVSFYYAQAEPNSQDWDLLLAAIRYAVNRLEMPPNTIDDVSTVPFVQDGLPAPPELTSYGVSSDPRSVPLLRRYNRRFGSVSMNRFYAETVNLLQAAIANRYMLKGILGASGTNTTFGPGVSKNTLVSLTCTGAAIGSSITHGMTFNFGHSARMIEFFGSGQAIDLGMGYSGGGASADINFSAMLGVFGRIRITMDRTYIMTPPEATQLSAPPVVGGFASATAAGVTLATISGNGCQIIVRGFLVGTTSFAVDLEITTAPGLTGNMGVSWSFIDDSETYNNPSPVRVYPAPAIYNRATDLRGSPNFA